MLIRNYKRRGVIVPLVCLLAFVVLAILAMATDLGYITVCKTQAQATADAGAVAGAARLATNNLIIGSTSQAGDIAAAKSAATDTIGRNHIGLGNNISLIADQPVFGVFDTSILPIPIRNFSPVDSVYVSVHNEVPLFLAKLFSVNSNNIGAVATAQTELCTIAGTRVNGNEPSPIIPIAMKQSDYQDMCTRYAANPSATGTLYPGNFDNTSGGGGNGGNGNGSNHGLLRFGTASPSGNILCNQVEYGPTPDQMTFQFPASGGLPAGWSPNLTGGFDFTPYDESTDPGLRASVFHHIQNGQIRLVPITTTTTVVNGSSATYHIVEWAAVTVSVHGNGANSEIWVQPAVFVNDGTLVPGGRQTAPGKGGVAVTSLVN